MSNSLNKPSELRASDSFDIDKVQNWINENVVGLPKEIPIVKQFSGGASNLTYALIYSNNESYILRTSPAGHKAASAHDMLREATIISKLYPVFPYVPKIYKTCSDHSIIGRDFYIMEFKKGIILRKNIPSNLNWNSNNVNELNKSLIDKLIDLHNVDYKSNGLQDIGKGEGYVKRQVNGWTNRFKESKTWNVPSFNKVINWIKENEPATESEICIIHNDFRLDNVILDEKEPKNIIGILDWEMATIGDPLMDIGTLLSYWIQADDFFILKFLKRQPSDAKGMMTRKEIINYYSEKRNISQEVNWKFYEVFGLFKLAVIVQQIYYRYHHKQTDNPAFKNFWIMNNYLNYRCKQLIKE